MLRLIRALGGKGNGMSAGKLHTELYPRKDLERKEMDALLDALSRAGYVSIESDTFLKDDGQEITYRRAMLTHEGRQAEGGEPLEHRQMRDVEAVHAGRVRTRERSGSSKTARPEKRASAEDAPLTALQKSAVANLRAWRAAEAKLLGKPAFVIFGDRVLQQLAVDAPSTLSELQRVSGIGPAKADRWGEAILQVLSTSAQAIVPQRTATQVSAAPSQPPLVLAAATVRTEASGPYTPATLEQALKVWRMHEAKRQDRAPLELLQDGLLREIVLQRPASVAALSNVAGVRRPWLEQFGDAICSVIAQYP